MKSSRAIPWSISIAIILFAITACTYWFLFVAPLKSAAGVAKALNFNGTITIKKNVSIKVDSNLTELAISLS